MVLKDDADSALIVALGITEETDGVLAPLFEGRKRVKVLARSIENRKPASAQAHTPASAPNVEKRRMPSSLPGSSLCSM
jgi:hypothetical protein